MTQNLQHSGGHLEADDATRYAGEHREPAERREVGTSYTATRFGLGFAVGMVAAGVAGVVTGELALAVFLGFAVALVLGIGLAEAR